MDNNRETVIFWIVLVSIVVIFGALTWVNYQYIVQNIGGDDFLPGWLGTRLFLTQGLSPYSEQFGEEVQNFVSSGAGRADDDQLLFSYPLFVVLVYGPVSLIGNYYLALALWMTMLEFLLAALGFLSISLSNWKPPIWIIIITILFSVFWFYDLMAAIHGNISILVALLIVLILFSIRNSNDHLAGFLLALSFIKPSLVFLLTLFIIFWSITHRRWSIIWTYLGSLAILVVAMSLLIPDWIVQNLRQTITNFDFTSPSTLGSLLAEWLPGVGNQLGWGITILLVGILLIEWWVARDKEFNWFMWTACITLVISNLVGLRNDVVNIVLLLPGLILVLAVWETRWGRLGRILVISSLLILFFGTWWLFSLTLQSDFELGFYLFSMFLFPITLVIGLYWVRYWASRSPKLLFG